MKEMLILSQINKPELSSFVDNVNKAAEYVHIIQTTYDDLILSFEDNEMRVTVRSLDRDIASFDAIHFKTSVQRDITAALARYAENHGLKTLDPVVKYFPTTSKLYQYSLLVGGEAATPRSLFVTPNVLVDSFELFKKRLGLPFILKDIHGSKGRFNEVIKNEEDFLRVSQHAKEQSIYVIGQSFIPNDGDYRVLIMGGEVQMVLYRTRRDDTTHLNNTSQGGNATLVAQSALPSKIIDWCVYATSRMGRDISGVDVVFNKSDNQWYYFEVNDGPQISTGSFIEEKVTVTAKYFDSLFVQNAGEDDMKSKIVIGRAEKVHFPELGDAILHARIDTGARTSSIWATDIEETDAGLHVRFASPEYDIYAHQTVFAHYDRVRVASSMGQSQVRYKVKMPVILGNRRILASFTLADRSTQVYPVLIGRSVLTGKFIVDVAKGSPLTNQEKHRSAELQESIVEEHI